MIPYRSSLVTAALALLLGTNVTLAEAPSFSDYCQRLQQEIQGKKHGFLAGNVTYYVGGFHVSWELKEHETLGLTHPFYHDLRSRGIGLVQSRGKDHDNTGLGNDFSAWEFYKDTRVLYGSVVIDRKVHRHPVPKRMVWRPDRMICEYEVDGVRLREEKFIAASDAACSIITASRPFTLRSNGQSFFGRHSLKSTATIDYDADHVRDTFSPFAQASRPSVSVRKCARSDVRPESGESRLLAILGVPTQILRSSCQFSRGFS
jgi:hypothetical protein